MHCSFIDIAQNFARVSSIHLTNSKNRHGNCFKTRRIEHSKSKMILTRVQHGLSPSGNLINMHKIGKIVSVGFNSQLLANA